MARFSPRPFSEISSVDDMPRAFPGQLIMPRGSLSCRWQNHGRQSRRSLIHFRPPEGQRLPSSLGLPSLPSAWRDRANQNPTDLQCIESTYEASMLWLKGSISNVSKTQIDPPPQTTQPSIPTKSTESTHLFISPDCNDSFLPAAYSRKSLVKWRTFLSGSTIFTTCLMFSEAFSCSELPIFTWRCPQYAFG